MKQLKRHEMCLYQETKQRLQAFMQFLSFYCGVLLESVANDDSNIHNTLIP